MKRELLDAGAAMATSEGFRLTSIARRQSEGSAAIRSFWAAARANAVSTLEEEMGAEEEKRLRISGRMGVGADGACPAGSGAWRAPLRSTSYAASTEGRSPVETFPACLCTAAQKASICRVVEVAQAVEDGDVVMRPKRICEAANTKACMLLV